MGMQSCTCIQGLALRKTTEPAERTVAFVATTSNCGGFLAMQTLPCKEWKNFFRTPGLGGFSVVSSRIQLKSLQKVLCTGVCDPTNTRYLNSRNLKFRLRSNAQNFKRFFNFPLGNRVQLDMIKSSNNAICGSLT